MKKEYIIKFKNSQAYIKSFENKNDMYTFDIKNAKRYEGEDAENIMQGKNELEVVKYQKELYKSKNEGFKLFAKALITQDDEDILNEDIEIFERELKTNGISVACNNLKNKYPQNILVNEMDRIAQKVQLKPDCDKKTEICKTYKELSKEYDYDDERQLEILKLTFYEKYITRDIILLSIPKCTIWVKYFCTKMYIFILSFLYNYIFSLII